MINIERFQCNMLGENCYVANDETNECIIVDCGAWFEEERQAVTDYIKENQFVPRHLLVTHGHADHNLGNDTIKKTFGLAPEICSADSILMTGLREQAEQMFNISIDMADYPDFKALNMDEQILFGSHKIDILPTPGHTPGGVCFYCREEGLLFSGDTLFKGSIGRTDFPGGSMFAIIQSLRALAQLPDSVTVLPGHGEQTTIGYELATNPYMDR